MYVLIIFYAQLRKSKGLLLRDPVFITFFKVQSFFKKASELKFAQVFFRC